MAQPQADWHDFQNFIQVYIPRQTIPYLKHFIEIIQQHTGRYVGLKTGDKKAVIVDKVVAAFTLLKTNNQHDIYRALRQKCEQVGTPPVNRYVPPQPAPTFGGASMPAPRAYPSAPAGPSTANGWSTTASSSAAYARPGPILADWKASPMWKPITAITNMEMLPEITAAENSHVRKERKITFTLSPDACEKMQQSKTNPSANPSYSVRLFCTSSDYFRPSNERVTPINAGVSNRSIPVEYPAVPDVRVDDLSIPFKERGLRGKAGSAPPFDMNKSSRGLTLIPNRLSSVTFGHTGATSGKKKELTKKFFFQVVLVEWTSKENLQRILINKPLTPLAECLAARKSRAEDDDIEVGSSRMSLKDPLSCMRITQPIRSTKCSHQQCFDATWWIESNATHPQWLCPFCNRELVWADLIADGFFFSILQAVPESVEEVIIEPDGEWHSEDDRFGSPAWLTAHASVPAPPPAPAPADSYRARKLSVTPPTRASSTSADPKGKRKAIEVLSSDDEDTPLGATLAPSLRPSRQQSLNGSTSSRAPINEGIIDLTLDSDDEDTATSRKDTGASGSDFRQPGVGFSRSATATASFPNAKPNPNVREQLNGDQDGPSMGTYRDELFDEDWDDELGAGPQSRYPSSSATRDIPPHRSRRRYALSSSSEPDPTAERPDTPPLPPTLSLPKITSPLPLNNPHLSESDISYGTTAQVPKPPAPFHRPSFTVPHRPSNVGVTPPMPPVTPPTPLQSLPAGQRTSTLSPQGSNMVQSSSSSTLGRSFPTAPYRLSNVDPALRSNNNPDSATFRAGKILPPAPKPMPRDQPPTPSNPAGPLRAPFPNPPRFPLPPRPGSDSTGRMVPTSHFAPQSTTQRQVVLPPTGPGQLRRSGLLDETIGRQQQ